jgi:hypothetical protein
MALALPDIGTLCVVLVVVVIIVLLVFILLLKFVIEFFPSVIIAGLVWWFSRDLLITLVAFLVSAIVFAIIGSRRRRGRGLM